MYYTWECYKTYYNPDIQDDVLASQVLRQWLSDSAAFPAQSVGLFYRSVWGRRRKTEINEAAQKPLATSITADGCCLIHLWVSSDPAVLQLLGANWSSFFPSSSYSGYSGRHMWVAAVAPVSLSQRADVQVCNWSLTFNTFTLLGVYRELIWMK